MVARERGEGCHTCIVADPWMRAVVWLRSTPANTAPWRQSIPGPMAGPSLVGAWGTADATDPYGL